MTLHSFCGIVLRCDQFFDTETFSTVVRENCVNILITVQNEHARRANDLKLEISQPSAALICF